jgi:hypothetical protein
MKRISILVVFFLVVLGVMAATPLGQFVPVVAPVMLVVVGAYSVLMMDDRHFSGN